MTATAILRTFVCVVLTFYVTSSACALEPSLYAQREVAVARILTDEGYISFVGNEGLFDEAGANYTKVFGQRPTTLWARGRRLKCYENAIRLSAQLASTDPHQDSIRRVENIAAGVEVAEALTALRMLKRNYVHEKHMLDYFRNRISYLLKRVDPLTQGGKRIHTTNLQGLNRFLSWAGIAMEIGEVTYAALLEQALCSDAALERIDHIESGLREAEARGAAVDPLWFQAVEDARANVTRDSTYFGALAGELEEKWVRIGSDVVVGEVIPHVLHRFHGQIEAHVAGWLHSHTAWSASKIAVHASHLAPLWTWSLAATYYTITGLLDQHEKAQTSVAASTLDYLLHEGQGQGQAADPEMELIVLQSQVTYFDCMSEVCSGFLVGIHSIISALFGQGYQYADAREYFEERRDETLEKLLAAASASHHGGHTTTERIQLTRGSADCSFIVEQETISGSGGSVVELSLKIVPEGHSSRGTDAVIVELPRMTSLGGPVRECTVGLAYPSETIEIMSTSQAAYYQSSGVWNVVTPLTAIERKTLEVTAEMVTELAVSQSPILGPLSVLFDTLNKWAASRFQSSAGSFLQETGYSVVMVPLEHSSHVPSAREVSFEVRFLKPIDDSTPLAFVVDASVAYIVPMRFPSIVSDKEGKGWLNTAIVFSPTRGHHNHQASGEATIGIIIDSSGSMGQNDRNDIRKQAAEIVVRRLLTGRETVFLVDFDGSATLLNAGAHTGWTEDELCHAIDRIDSSGGTEIELALACMADAMSQPGIDLSRGGVLLLSDGMDEVPPGSESWFTNHGVPVFTVGLSGDVNEELLQYIARRTGGDYLKARTAGDIVNAFMRFYDSLSGRVAYVTRTGMITQGQVVNIEFYVDCGDQPMDVFCSWEGSTVGLLLRSPSGIEYSELLGRGEWRSGANYIAASILLPETGRWVAELRGVSIPPGGEQYTFEVHADADQLFDLVRRDQGGEDIQGAIEFDLIPDEPSLLQAAERHVRVMLPDGMVEDITGRFDGGGFTYLPFQGRGTYQFYADIRGINADGRRYQRSLRRDVFVGKYVPLHIARIGIPLGNFVTAPLGLRIGNRPSMRCYLYRGQPGNRDDLISEGYVMECGRDDCTVLLQKYYALTEPREGDYLMLDERQWRGD